MQRRVRAAGCCCSAAVDGCALIISQLWLVNGCSLRSITNTDTKEHHTSTTE